jgi:hypothetical protein
MKFKDAMQHASVTAGECRFPWMSAPAVLPKHLHNEYNQDMQVPAACCAKACNFFIRSVASRPQCAHGEDCN